MPKSIRNPLHIRARLLLLKTSVKRIALKHGAPVSTVYAVLNGRRPGTRAPQQVRDALEEIRRG